MKSTPVRQPGAPVAAPEAQCADAVLMVRPAHFASNPQTARSNVFQHLRDAPPEADAQPDAAAEFDRVAAALRGAGVQVVVVEDTDEPRTPDSVFPNNWLSTHADGRCAIYPMMAPNRRGERRLDIIDDLLPQAGFVTTGLVDLSPSEANGVFLEGTGSLVLDRPGRVAYACRSARTSVEAAEAFAARFGYALSLFEARDSAGGEIYHTNVLMSVGEDFAVVCAEAIVDPATRTAVRAGLAGGGRTVIEISGEQMHAFAGNVLQLATREGTRVVAMSRSAFEAFSPGQREVLARRSEVLAVPIDTIEYCSGGSVRCMLAEIHLPRRPAAPTSV
jgi:hypothetical protein